MTDFHEFHAEIFIFDRFDTGSDRVDRTNKLPIKNYRDYDCDDDDNFGYQEKEDLLLDQIQGKYDECDVNECDKKNVFSSEFQILPSTQDFAKKVFLTILARCS